MKLPTTSSSLGALTAISTRHPTVVALVTLAITALLLAQASQNSKEVGYAAYFGPDDPRVIHLSEYLDEFQSGIHILLVFSCRESEHCDRVGEPWTLGFLGRLHNAVSDLSSARSIRSILNTPIIYAPLAARSIAEKSPDGSWSLTDDWQHLLTSAKSQAFIDGTVISQDGVSAGIVIELQSIDSESMRAVVHGITSILPDFERELGAPLYMAGDPVWTVYSADSLDRDSNVLTVVMFVAMFTLLWLIFRDLSLTAIPVISVGVLFCMVQGLTALLGIPLTSVLTAIPPVLVTIAMTASIHFLMAFTREFSGDAATASIAAAHKVGSGCFWSAFTTTLGFASFMLADLVTFRHFGLLASAGLIASLILTFSLIPSLLCLRNRFGSWAASRHRAVVPRELLAATFSAVTSSPAVTLCTCLAVMIALSLGIGRLHYANDFGFGEDSYVFRSLDYIDSNFRRPMTTEVSLSIPAGKTIFDETPLRALHLIEEVFLEEETTGASWSFLDLLSEAYRADRGHPAKTVDEIISAAPSLSPIATASDLASSYWSVASYANAPDIEYHRARVSVDRGWLDDRTQGPYVQRIQNRLAKIEQELPGSDYHIQLEGGLILADSFVNGLRQTQQRSFLAAFLIVSITLLFLLPSDPKLLGWAITANVMPVVGLLGLMGWAEIGIDPANTMVAAVLLVIAVDDTIHISLRYLRERRSGANIRDSLERTYTTVGEAVVVSSASLAIGFSVLCVSQWAGLMWFGVLASLGVIFALLSDLLLLPAALLVAAQADQRSGNT